MFKAVALSRLVKTTALAGAQLYHQPRAVTVSSTMLNLMSSLRRTKTPAATLPDQSGKSLTSSPLLAPAREDQAQAKHGGYNSGTWNGMMVPASAPSSPTIAADWTGPDHEAAQLPRTAAAAADAVVDLAPGVDVSQYRVARPWQAPNWDLVHGASASPQVPTPHAHAACM